MEGQYSEEYLKFIKWCKENPKFTGNQVEFAEFCLANKEMIGKMGDMTSIFLKVREYVKHN
jgi:hypothetical protein